MIKKKLADDFNNFHSCLKFETSVNAHMEAALFGHKGGKAPLNTLMDKAKVSGAQELSRLPVAVKAVPNLTR